MRSRTALAIALLAGFAATQGGTVRADNPSRAVPIVPGDTCHRCERVLADPFIGAEVVGEPGVGASKFRTIRCMLAHLRETRPEISAIYVVDSQTGKLVHVDQAVFVPVLISQSTNTGGQTLAVTLRGLSLGELESGKEKALVMKEALLGLLNGVFVGLVAAIAMYAAATVQHLSIALMLSAVVFLAMTGSCVVSGICGAIVPLALKKVGADPATASSIVLTTATDVASLALLLGLATVLVR